MPNKIEAFRKKYGNPDNYPPSEVGRAVIASLVYDSLQSKEKDAADVKALFTTEQRDSLLQSITTKAEHQKFVAYRQVEEWIYSRRKQAVSVFELACSVVRTILTRLYTIVWAESLEKELSENGVRVPATMAKIDAAMLAADAGMRRNSAIDAEDVKNALYDLNVFNTKLALIAKEIKIPELTACFAIDVTTIVSSLTKINEVIEAQRKEILENAESNAEEELKKIAYTTHTKTYPVTADAIPPEQIKMAKAQIKGLAVFLNKPTGGTGFDTIFTTIAKQDSSL